MNHYKAPRDKLICILNCCKVIFGTSQPLFSLESLAAVSSFLLPFQYINCRNSVTDTITFIPGLIRHVNLSEGADSFIPILIFVVLKANPEHLLSNVESAPYLCPYPLPVLTVASDISIASGIRTSCKVRQGIICPVW